MKSNRFKEGNRPLVGSSKSVEEGLKFLVESSHEIEDFDVKLSTWLKPATISHLKVSFGFNESEAVEVINTYLGE